MLGRWIVDGNFVVLVIGGREREVAQARFFACCLRKERKGGTVGE